MDALMAVPNIDQPMPTMKTKPGEQKLSRQEAEAYEQALSNLPRLSNPVYVGNMEAGTIVMNDMGITIKLNEIIDLSKVPARKIIESRELRGLLIQKILRFCSEAEYITYLNVASSLGQPKHESLATGSREEMEAMMEYGHIPPEIANKRGPKPLVSTADVRDAVEIDLDDGGDDAELDEEMKIFEQISSDPTDPTEPTVPRQVDRPAPKAGSGVRSVRRAGS